jgi:hypothetical protein
MAVLEAAWMGAMHVNVVDPTLKVLSFVVPLEPRAGGVVVGGGRLVAY